MCFATFFLAIGATVFIGGPAHANSTYFEEYVVKCTFPDGNTATLSIQRGEGTYGPEPATLYLSDERGLSIGFLPVYRKIFLVKQGAAGCGAIDPHNLLFYQPDANEIPDLEAPRNNLATRETGQQSFGFSQRALGVGEILRASAQVIAQRKGEAAGFFAIVLASIAILFWLIRGDRSKNNVWVVIAKTAASVVGLGFVGFFAVVLTNLGGLGWMQISFSAALGAGVFFAGLMVAKR